jgi:RNA polymerase-binding transcription factor DksA
MAISGSPFAKDTLTMLVELLRARRVAAARSAAAFRRQAVEELERRATSEHFECDPCADSDAEQSRVVAERAERSVLEIEAALARIESGTYGYCEDCSVGIPLERLAALPATPVCIGCSGRRCDSPNRALSGVPPGGMQ